MTVATLSQKNFKYFTR